MLIRLMVMGFAVSGVASGNFEKWTSRDGKEAELDLIAVTKSKDVRSGSFVMKDGRIVTLKESDLSQESARRLALPSITEVSYQWCLLKEDLPDHNLVQHQQHPDASDPFAELDKELALKNDPPGAVFIFHATGPNLLGVAEESLELGSFVPGDGTESREKRVAAVAIPDKVPAGKAERPEDGPVKLPFGIAFGGDYSADDLKNSKMAGGVKLLFGTGMTSATAKLRLKKMEKTGLRTELERVGPFNICFGPSRDKRLDPESSEFLLASDLYINNAVSNRKPVKGVSPDPLEVAPRVRIVDYEIVADGKKLGPFGPDERTSNLVVGEELSITVWYWKNVHELPFAFSKKPGEFRSEK
ncbi:MAG: hypothetical protein V4584_16245 [Verrucomicrobiota bacterium]